MRCDVIAPVVPLLISSAQMHKVSDDIQLLIRRSTANINESQFEKTSFCYAQIRSIDDLRNHAD